MDHCASGRNEDYEFKGPGPETHCPPGPLISITGPIFVHVPSLCSSTNTTRTHSSPFFSPFPFLSFSLPLFVPYPLHNNPPPPRNSCEAISLQPRLERTHSIPPSLARRWPLHVRHLSLPLLFVSPNSTRSRTLIVFSFARLNCPNECNRPCRLHYVRCTRAPFLFVTQDTLNVAGINRAGWNNARSYRYENILL